MFLNSNSRRSNSKGILNSDVIIYHDQQTSYLVETNNKVWFYYKINFVKVFTKQKINAMLSLKNEKENPSWK